MYFLYNILFNVWLGLFGPFLLRSHRKRGRPLADIKQRLGDVSNLPEGSTSPVVWFHACSVGETLSIQKLVDEFHAAEPDARLVFSTVTSTGQAVAKERFAKFGEGSVFYLPLDTTNAVCKTLDRIRPLMLVIVETEIWPNLVHEAKRRGIPVVMVNGRISPRSFKTYRFCQPFFGKVFQNYRALLAGSAVDAKRLQKMGAAPGKLIIAGNLKYDMAAGGPDNAKIERVGSDLGLKKLKGPLIVGGSTHEGEDEMILEAFQTIRKTDIGKGVTLLLAPRHPDRAASVCELAQQAGLTARLRSESNTEQEPRDVIVLDTVGELTSIYAYATVAFVGGSLVNIGGHSILEPAAFGKPILVGPYMQNSPDVIDVFEESKAVLQISATEKDAGLQAQQLVEGITRLLSDPAMAEEMGKRARAILDDNKGATERIVGYLRTYLAEKRLDGPEAPEAGS